MQTPLLFTSWYTGLGGGETGLLTAAEQLSEQSYFPHLLQPYEGQLAEKWREHGWPVHITKFRGATVYFIPSVWARFPVVNRIADIIRKEGIKAVHSDYHSLPMSLPAAKRMNLPVVWTCSGWWFRPKFWQRGFFRQVDAIFADSAAIKRGFLGDPPFMPPDRITVNYPGVDTGRFSPELDGVRVRFDAAVPQDAPLVVLIARFQDVKGHDVFQDVARQVVLQIPEAYFIVAGESVHSVASEDAYKRRILATHANDPLLRKYLKYIGFRDDVERVIAAADVVLCTSDFESYGRAVVEAMAGGKPVVSTNQGGPSETVLHGETGFLVPPRDSVGLARYTIQLLRDAELRQRMGEAARQRVVEGFSAQATAERYRQAFAHLI